MAALEAAGHDTANLTVEMLNLVDQMHFGGLNSTKRQAEALKGVRVLDPGCAKKIIELAQQGERDPSD